MIDTSIVRVHQHAACIARNKGQSMGGGPLTAIGTTPTSRHVPLLGASGRDADVGQGHRI
jgi:hypothetical protein